MKARFFKRVASVASVVAVSLYLVSCGGEAPTQPQPTAQTQAQAVVEEETLDPVEVPDIDHALITFLTGDAWLNDGEGERIADIGDYLEPDQELRVETGYVELQAGNLGTVRVQEAATIRLENIVLDPESRAVDVRVVSGSVLNKVNRLAGNDSYEVRTETAVMGVRGTEFGVRVSDEGDTDVAVREGSVAVVPPAADPERLRERAREAGAEGQSVDAALRAFEEDAPVIAANQQVTLDRTTAALAEETVRPLEAALVGDAGADGDGAPQDLTQTVAETTRRLRESAQQTTAAVDPENEEELAQIDDIRAIQVGAEEEAPSLLPVRLRVEPTDAVITLNGREVGRGRFSGVFLPDEELSFLISREGYIDETLELTVGRENGRAYRVALAALAAEQAPEAPSEARTASVDISAAPGDAAIFVDGEEVGVGTAQVEAPVGSALTVRAQLDGYDSVEREIEVAEAMDTVGFALERSVAGIRIEASPSDAEIRINGEVVGRGEAVVERPLGETVQVEVARSGYAAAEREVEVAGTAEAVRFDLDQLIGRLSVNVEPSDAEIVIDGEPVAEGTFEREYPAGTQLDVTFRRRDFATVTVPVTVREGENPLRYELSRDLGTLQITAEPTEAEILLNGSVVGTGSVRQELPAGQEVQVGVEAAGYVGQERTVTVSSGNTPLRFALERRLATVTVNPVPQDAEVRIDGRSLGSGTVQREYPVEQRLTVQATRPGYAPMQRSVVVDDEGSSVELRMEPRPIEATVAVTDGSFVRALATDGTLVYGADAAGSVYAVDPAGRVVWNYQTRNAGNENSMPVFADGIVAFSGATELVFLTPNSGSPVGTVELTGSDSHLFGRRPVPWQGDWFVPSDEELTLVDRAGVARGVSVAIPGGSKMTPALLGSTAVIADQQGQVLVMSLPDGEVQARISTAMSQPVALAPSLTEGRAYLIGRRGVAAAVDTESGTLLWEATPIEGRGAFVDPVPAGPVVLFHIESRIVALSSSDGATAYTLEDAGGAPLPHGDSVYYGTRSGELRRVDSASGRVTGTVELSAGVAGAPVLVGERIAVPMADGSITIVHPAGIR